VRFDRQHGPLQSSPSKIPRATQHDPFVTVAFTTNSLHLHGIPLICRSEILLTQRTSVHYIRFPRRVRQASSTTALRQHRKSITPSLHKDTHPLYAHHVPAIPITGSEVWDPAREHDSPDWGSVQRLDATSTKKSFRRHTRRRDNYCCPDVQSLRRLDPRIFTAPAAAPASSESIRRLTAATAASGPVKPVRRYHTTTPSTLRTITTTGRCAAAASAEEYHGTLNAGPGGRTPYV
jgi:hypothetical protein